MLYHQCLLGEGLICSLLQLICYSIYGSQLPAKLSIMIFAQILPTKFCYYQGLLQSILAGI
ncbi:hypothetical protein BDW62DRAFT_188508 [Aspergillus aurantiobrunneus]